MDAVLSVQFSLLLIIGFVGLISNAVCMRALSLLKSKTFDSTTLRLMKLVTACHLIICVGGIPLRLWNVYAGRGEATGKPLSDSNAICWLFVSTYFLSAFTASWLLLMLALTRLVAVLMPHKYDNWSRNRIVKWLLCLIPWTLPYSTNIVGAIVMYEVIPEVAVESSTYGVCYTMFGGAGTSRSSLVYALIHVGNNLGPLALGFLSYIVIMGKLAHQKIVRRQQGVTDHTVLTTIQSNGHALNTGQAADGPDGNPVGNSKKKTAKELQSQERHRRVRSVKILAWSYFLILAFVVPWPLLMGALGISRFAWLGVAMEVLAYMQTLVCPLVYGLTMPDMRAAYKNIMKMLKFWK